ncbi:type IV toxin-antitoxin system AbiEi family antitoxin domain-containing protein [Phytoactinopolyspora limicola]|uniref:type IV toxin-antitoxin system AbiEi family antitoxin domain-containing protein n=1 Tax=Phytoactinopolyspora limicola TaxID=2715536 RepID=UPI00140BABE2|nr:type IV toxin-antitoxin system AbiEi family antitoxin domain-containing protein [Phytoactinopolyspora limicola]
MDDDLKHLATTQLDLITHTQALQSGMTPSAIRHKLRSKRWTRILPGVYAIFNGQLTPAHHVYAASMYGGTSARITGARACQLLGLRYVPDDEGVQLLARPEDRRPQAGFVRIIVTTRLPGYQLWRPSPAEASAFVKPVRVASVARAVMDTSRTVGLITARTIPRRANGQPILTVPGADVAYRKALQDVRALTCEAIQRGLTTVDALADELEHGPRRGSALARRAVDDVSAGCRSAPECELRDLIASSEILPTPTYNGPLPGLPNLVPDAYFSIRRLIVEVDSVEWHRFGDMYEKTEQRRALLASHGWLVIPVSPQRLRACPHDVLAEIEAAYLSERAA